jgi:PKD repeat protein
MYSRNYCVSAIFAIIISLSLLRANPLVQTSGTGDPYIANFYSCDASGILQDYFPKKTTAYFNVSITNPGQNPKNISVYVTVEDTLDVPVGSYRMDATVPRNSSTYYITSVFLPKWAYVGVATAYASLLEEGSPIDSKTVQFYIGPEDLTPPVIHILSPRNATYGAESISLVFTINERTTWIGYSMDGLSNVTVSKNTTLPYLNGGSHRIRVYAKDTSGNIGLSEEVHFTILVIHDVAIIDLKCSSAKVCVGQVIEINVTVLNEGTMTETFNVSTYANSTAIETLTVTNLPRNNQESLALKWNTTGVTLGKYTIKAVASTVAGETNTADNIYIDGYVKIIKPPVAHFTYSPTVPLTGETISLNASLSTPDGGIIINYEWDFGDKTLNVTGMIATHLYVDDGTYTVTLAVTDSDGLIDNCFQNITVLNRPPTALFTESATSVFTGTIVHFNASQSFDPDGSIVAYAWSFGDGNSDSSSLVNHSYVDNGVYNVTLTVMDNDNASSDTWTIETILDRPPVANFNETAEAVYVDEPVSFNASTSYDPDGIIIAYFWDFGDGTKLADMTADHSYDRNGTYTITLTIMDDDGMSASKSSIMNVLNRPDIAVSNVMPSKTVLGQGYLLKINVTVSNRGDSVETFDVTIYAGATSIGAQAITLTAGNSKTITFTWDTSGFAYGNYTIWAYAWPLPGETDTADNALISGLVYVRTPGDINADGIVDVFDASILANTAGSRPGDARWNPNVDINGDNIVDIFDAVILANHVGEHQ